MLRATGGSHSSGGRGTLSIGSQDAGACAWTADRMPEGVATGGTESAAMELDPCEWAEREFSDCELGDRRRTRRLIKAAAQALARPDGSTPDQAESWGDCKAVYRLMSCEDVSFEALTTPHYQRTRNCGKPGQALLLINDTTEINYGHQRRSQGLGLVGQNTGRGFFLHTALMRDPETKDVLGLAGQEIFYRKTQRKKAANNSRRRDPERESAVWGRLIDQVGSPPQGVRWLHVCDRGADDYEVFCHAYRQGCGWVIRACRLNRQIETPDQRTITLEEHLDLQPVQGVRTLEVPATASRAARTARLELRYAPLSLPVPRVTNAWIRQHAPQTPLPMWVVELVEIDSPMDTEPVKWVLLTSERVDSIDEANRIVDYYTQRWAVEEYHKALKTGCRVEARYYETAARLERVTGLLAIVAVQLLKLRSVAEREPDKAAKEMVPEDWVNILARARRLPSKVQRSDMTLAQFVKHLAGLGGHLGRKCDGRPGWITLWRGLEKLLLILRGARAVSRRCG